MAIRNAGQERKPEENSRTLVSNAGQRVLMTLRVSRDSGRTWERTITVREGDPVVLMEGPQYPMCECRRCTGRHAAPARSPYPAP